MLVSMLISFLTLTLGLIVVLYFINTDPSFHFNESLRRNQVNPVELHLRTANEIISFLFLFGLMSVSILMTSKSKVESSQSQEQVFMNILKACEKFKATNRLSENEAQQMWESTLLKKRQEELDARDEDEVYETDSTFSLQLFRILFEFDPQDRTSTI